MATEMIANVQNQASILSIVTASAKSKPNEESSEKFAQVLGDRKEDMAVETAVDAKGEHEKEDVEKAEAEAVMMTAYVPFAGYRDVNVEETGVELTDPDIAEVSETAVKMEAPLGEISTDSEMIELPVQDAGEADGSFDLNIKENAGEIDAELAGSIGDAETTQVTVDKNTETFTKFIGGTDVQMKEIESVKYVTFNAPIHTTNRAEMLSTMEMLIQNMFLGELEKESEEDGVKVDENGKPIADEGQHMEAVSGVVTEDTVSKGESKSVLTEIEVAQEPAVSFEVEAESAADTGKENNDNAAEDQGDFGDSLENSPLMEKPRNVFGLTQTETFRIYNIDTNGDTAQQIGRAMNTMLKTDNLLSGMQETKEMVLQLQPETLGKIIIKLQSVDGVLDIKISATNAEVRDMLSSQMAQLNESIKEQGVSLANMQLEQSALQNNREQSGNSYNGRQDTRSEQDNEEEIDYQAMMEDIEAALSGIEMMI